jgi:Co/Zn/Cd efflux system component
MAGGCEDTCGPRPEDSVGAYRRVLIWALVINAVMFLVEAAAGIFAGSAALQADAIDFLGDAANYGVSLLVLGMVLKRRAQAALLKGVTMGLFGIWVAVNTVLHGVAGDVPLAGVMGAIGFLALLCNVGVAAMLFPYRRGDSNMRSVWLCSRNDALANMVVMAAAGGVYFFDHGAPDWLVAGVMAAIALSSSYQVIRQSLGELRGTPAAPAP